MKTTLKRLAIAGAMSGALGFAALGLSAGAANADTTDIPFVPGNSGDWQSYFPLVERLGDVVPNVANLGDLGGTGATADTGSKMPSSADLQVLSDIAMSNIRNGQWQDLLGMVGDIAK